MLAATGAQAEAPAGYYSSCENKGGRTLLSALHSKVGPHTVVSYDGLWDLFKTSDVKPNGKIWDMYSTKEWPIGSQHCGDYKKVGDCYNREHSFPKSWFNDAKPMYSDAFHLYPTDGKVNGQRSNYPYGECANGTYEASANGVQALGKRGTSTFPGYSGIVFEPDDEYKGDFARSYFYMATAYNDRISTWSSDMLAGNNFPAFRPWAIQLLLKWHRNDPVSDKERKRNDAVYARQKNRNPYIDHPEMVEYIWGDKASQTWTSTAASGPQITLPVDGSKIDMGYSARNVALTKTITVRTANATAPVSLAFNGREFDVNPSTLPAAQTNTPDGATATVTFMADATGIYSEAMTITSGAASARATFTVEVIDGLHAGPAANISDTGFDAIWAFAGDADASGCYTLSVTDARGQALEGYPAKVNAAAGRHRVDGLEPSTPYVYSLASENMVSDPVSVTTADPVPSVDFLFEGDLHFATEPSKPSPEAELWIETDNVDSDYTVEVKAPFLLSADRTSWTRTITLSPEDDRIYLRLLSDNEGEFESPIVATVGTHRIDDAVVTGTVRAPEADFFETFENYDQSMGSYGKFTYQGTACLWLLEDTGMWTTTDDRPHGGDHAIRGGKNGKAVIEMAEDRRDGIGMLRLWARVWREDAAPAFDVMLSTDSGSSWTKVGAITLDGQDYRKYSCPVNAQGPARIKLVQTAGKRFVMDDLSLTSHTSGLAAPGADHNRWNAWCPAPGVLTVTASSGDTRASVYSLDGLTLAADRPVSPGSPLTLEGLTAPEVYIVVVGDFSRRVLVK